MSSDEPGVEGWANPGQPVVPVPQVPPAPPTGSTPAWGAPVDPSAPTGWSTPPTPPGWGYAAPPPYAGGPPPQPGYGWGPMQPQAPKPGVVPLRPLGVGELLDGAFTTIRRYPAATLGLSAAVMLVVEAITIAVQYLLLHGVTQTTFFNTNGTVGSTNGDYAARLFSSDGILFVVTLIATALLSGMVAGVMGKAVLGRPMNAGQAWSTARPVFLRLLGATGLVFLIELAIIAVGIVPGVVVLALGSEAGGAVLLVIGIPIATVALIWVEVLLLFTNPIVMLEKQGIRAAIRRSRALVTDSWWRTFGIQLLALIIAGVISAVFILPFGFAGGLGSVLSGHPGAQYTFGNLLLTGIGGFLGGTLVRPFSAGISTLLYLDRRMRAEALDLTLQQAANNPS